MPEPRERVLAIPKILEGLFDVVAVVGQIGTTVALGLLFDTLIVRSFMTPSIAALLGRWFWWPVRVHQRPIPQKFGDETTRQLSLV